MLKKRILASSMASVMALASVASTAVTAFADDATTTASVTTDMAQHDAEALKAYIEEVKKTPGFDINEYGTYTINAFNTAMQYAEAQAKQNNIDNCTVAYQMLKAVFDNRRKYTQDELQALINDVKPIVDNNNVWSEALDDSQYTDDSFEKLSEAYSEARSKIKKTSKDINDAYEKLEQAKLSLQTKQSVTKSQFNNAFKSYDDQLKRFGAYETWRRGQVKPADGVDVGNYKDLKVTWGALHNHINSSYETIRIQYERLNEVKSLPQNITYDEEIYNAYTQIQQATNILASFVPDEIGATANAKSLDKLVDKYKSRILYSTVEGHADVMDLYGAFANYMKSNTSGQDVYSTDSDRTNVKNGKRFESSTNGFECKVYNDDDKLSEASCKVNVDAPFGIIRKPDGTWKVLVIGVQDDTLDDKANPKDPITIKTKADIDKITKSYDELYSKGYRGYSFSQTTAKKGVELTDYVDIPFTGDPADSDPAAYSAKEAETEHFVLTPYSTDDWIHDVNDDQEDLNDYKDTQFDDDRSKASDILADNKWLSACSAVTDKDVSPEGQGSQGDIYGVAPNVVDALELWNTYRKEGSVVRGKDSENGYFTQRKAVLGQSGKAANAGRYQTPNDASLVSLRDGRISNEEYELVYRYMQYALSDMFDGNTKSNKTYRDLDVEQINDSYDIFNKTKDAELFTAGHVILGQDREAAVELVRASHPAGLYGDQLTNAEQTDYYDKLKDSKETLIKEYNNFAISYEDVFNKIAQGAKALDDGNANVNAGLVANVAKALAYIQPLLDNEGDEVDLENDPFSDNNTNLIGYHRVYTYEGNDSVTLRRPGEEPLTLGRATGKNGEAQGLNYTHYNLNQAYKALEAALNAEAPAVTVKLGDVNNDGKILANDAVLILKKDAGVETFTEDQAKAADVNKDDKVNVLDAVAILKHTAGVELITD